MAYHRRRNNSRATGACVGRSVGWSRDRRPYVKIMQVHVTLQSTPPVARGGTDYYYFKEITSEFMARAFGFDAETSIMLHGNTHDSLVNQNFKSWLNLKKN